MALTNFLTILLQILGDFLCCSIALYCAYYKKHTYRSFFLLNSIAFLSLAVGDIYYNYNFRILKSDISQSIGLVVTITMLIFQLSQICCWIILSRSEKYKLVSKQNIPYILFSLIMIITLVFYFISGNNPSTTTIWYQSITIILDMIIWLYAIISLSITRSKSIVLLAFGCLMIISADLTTRCLFMTNMSEVISSQWIHLVWTAGVIVMAVGFIICTKSKSFSFYTGNSMQATCCSWLSITSFAVFLIGFVFLGFLNFSHNNSEYFRSILWSLPVTLVFTMVTSVLLGNWFSKIILHPINSFLKRIEAFNKNNFDPHDNTSISTINEFKLLGEFIDNSFIKLSKSLDNEIRVAEQVAHDIRSPLSALEVIIKRLPEIDDTKKVLLRDAIVHIRDITTNLEKKASSDNYQEKATPLQIAVLLEQLLTEKKASLQNQEIKFQKVYNSKAYGFFILAEAPILRRVLTNILNNSCESITTTGSIKINLYQQNSYLTITINDTGSGISKKNLELVFTRGYTNKKYGKGLGLYYAKEIIKKWNGKIYIQSERNQGTEVKIELPLIPPPPWFVGHLLIKPNESIICVDDSISMRHVWNERLKKYTDSIRFKHCSSQNELNKLITTNNSQATTCFIDYEFSGENYSGIDIIEKMLLKRKHIRIFLVTSHYQEPQIQNFCIENNIFLIPKAFTPEIPIELIEPATIRRIIITHKVNKGLLSNSIFFKTINDYFANAYIFSTETKVYICKKLLTEETKYKLEKSNIVFMNFNNLDTLINKLSSS